ncbi:MAG: anthranilate phosphoribosyltransferase, partial [Thermodesulfobacteriota bacterium]
EAAVILKAALGGQPGPRADMAVLNAGAAFLAAGRAASLADGVALARKTIASGAALAKLEDLVAFGRG